MREVTKVMRDNLEQQKLIKSGHEEFKKDLRDIKEIGKHSGASETQTTQSENPNMNGSRRGYGNPMRQQGNGNYGDRANWQRGGNGHRFNGGYRGNPRGFGPRNSNARSGFRGYGPNLNNNGNQRQWTRNAAENPGRYGSNYNGNGNGTQNHNNGNSAWGYDNNAHCFVNSQTGQRSMHHPDNPLIPVKSVVNDPNVYRMI